VVRAASRAPTGDRQAVAQGPADGCAGRDRCAFGRSVAAGDRADAGRRRAKQQFGSPRAPPVVPAEQANVVVAAAAASIPAEPAIQPSAEPAAEPAPQPSTEPAAARAASGPHPASVGGASSAPARAPRSLIADGPSERPARKERSRRRGPPA
jgi:hypothetical protein